LYNVGLRLSWKKNPIPLLVISLKLGRRDSALIEMAQALLHVHYSAISENVSL
jgi:hypothetical protein